MSATYVVCGSCGADSSQSAEAIRHKPNCPRMTATPSQEWTVDVEDGLKFFAIQTLHPNEKVRGATDYAGAFAREINRQRDEVARLRAENERLTKVFRVDDFREIIDENLSEFLRPDDSEAPMWVYASAICAAASEITALRSQLAATREGETPRLVGDPLRPKIDGAVVTPVHDVECPTVRQRDSECTCGGMQAAARAAHYKGYPDARSTTSRSRESDNG